MISRTFYFFLNLLLKVTGQVTFVCLRGDPCKIRLSLCLVCVQFSLTVSGTKSTKHHVKHDSELFVKVLSKGFVSGQPQDRRVDLEVKNVKKSNKKTAGNQKIIVTPPLGGVTMIF